MKLQKKIFLMGLLIIGALFLWNHTAYAGEQRLNQLDYKVTLKEDGSMDVVETWDVYVSETNTMFKDFVLDRSKYSGITNVQVRDLDRNLDLEQIYSEMYHVTKDCFYGLEVVSGKFEIAWGVGLDNSSDTRKYRISYTIEDAITVYNDCSELYWQFVGTDNAIPVREVTGTINLPKAVNNSKNLHVWAHGPLNGEIRKLDNQTVWFGVNGLDSQKMLEVRVVSEEDMFPLALKRKSYDELNFVLEEEAQWAEQANRQREINRQVTRVVIGGIIVSYILLSIWFFTRILKYRKQYKEMPFNRYEEVNIGQYFRDIPREKDATPAQAAFLYYSKKNRFYLRGNLQHVFSATLLDLCLKGYLSFDCENKKDILITILKDNSNNQLPEDEKVIFDLLNTVAKEAGKLTMKDLKEYAKVNYDKFAISMEDLGAAAKEKHKELNNYDEESTSQIYRLELKEFSYIAFSILLIFWGPLVIEWIICAIYLHKTTKKMRALTEQGEIERQQWQGLEKYMKEFSLLKEKEVPDLVLWEKYLVYATVFGISKEVMKQLKVVYPEFSDLDTGTYTYMYLMADTRFENGFVNMFENSVQSVYRTYQSASSSASGEGGGFSGGGGGRRRRWPEWVEDKIV